VTVAFWPTQGGSAPFSKLPFTTKFWIDI